MISLNNFEYIDAEDLIYKAIRNAWSMYSGMHEFHRDLHLLYLFSAYSPDSYSELIERLLDYIERSFNKTIKLNIQNYQFDNLSVRTLSEFLLNAVNETKIKKLKNE